jgi:hypothetical protein
VDILGFELVADNAMGPTRRWLQVRPNGGDAPWGRLVTFDDPDRNGIVLQETAADPAAGAAR